MLKTTTLMALALGATATEKTYPSNTVFTWDRNTNVGDARNWDHADGQTPTGSWGVVDLNVDCINNFGPDGGQVKVDESFTVSELNLPMNGEVVLGEGSTITFEEGSTNLVSFQCSTRDTACSKNWKVSTANGQEMVAPDRPPCHEDVAIINGVDGHMIDWHSNQHLATVNIAMENAEIKSYSSDKSAEFAARFAALTSSWRGSAPIIGNPNLCGQSESCKTSCYDSCPPEADDIDGDLVEFFSEMDEKKKDVKAKAERANDALKFLKDIETTSRSALGQVIEDAAKEYETDCECTRGTDQVTEQIDFTVSSQDMFDWISEAKINRRRSPVTKQSIKYASTFGSVSGALDFLSSTADLTNVWTAVDPTETGTLQNSGVAEFFFGTGLQSNGINNDLTPLGVSLSGGIVSASGVNPGDEADHSQGQYVFENVNIVGTQKDNETDQVFFSERALQLIASASVTKFQLWFVSKAANDQANLFTAQIAARTAAPTSVPTSSAPTVAPSVSPTVSPSVSPSASPTVSPTAAEVGLLEGTNGIMIYGGAGGGLVLIILIIVIACLLTKKGSSKASKPEEQRNVVAFENPMYDDPAATTQVNDAEEPGLYDEPSFNQGADKENPMYQSQENVEEPSSGGYLDVQPDDEDDDDDDDEDEDDEDEDE